MRHEGRFWLQEAGVFDASAEASVRARNPEKAIIQPGRNVWETHPADKVLFLIDADAYFRQIQPVLKKARRSIWIVGWDLSTTMTRSRSAS